MKVKPITIESVTSRAALPFVAQVQEHFAFLEQQGFRCARSEMTTEVTLVRFEGSTFYLSIYHEHRSSEIGLAFGRRGNEKRSYSIADFLGIAGVPSAREWSRDYAAVTPDGVKEGLAKLAKLVRNHVVPNLHDAKLFQKLEKQSRIRLNKWTLEMDLAQARQKLAAAWRAKDYAKIITVLRPLRNALTPSELRKLDYAERHAT